MYTWVKAIDKGVIGAFREGDTPSGVLFPILSTLDDMKEFYPTFAAPEEWTLAASFSFSKVSCRICSLS